MTIYIKAPTNNQGSWGADWHELDIDRVDQSVLSPVQTYPQLNGETNINCFQSAKISCVLTGHITDDSDIPGTGTVEKAIELLNTGKTWYRGLRAVTSGFPQYKDEESTYNLGIQKISLIEESRFNSELVNYQLGLVLKWGG